MIWLKVSVSDISHCLRFRSSGVKRSISSRDPKSLSQKIWIFHHLLNTWPYLGFDDDLKVQVFYISLDRMTLLHLDSSTRGSFLDLKLTRKNCNCKFYASTLDRIWRTRKSSWSRASPDRRTYWEENSVELIESGLALIAAMGAVLEATLKGV